MGKIFKDLDPDTMVRSPGITYQELLDTDSHDVPDVLRIQSPKDLGHSEFSVDRYISKDWHDKEVERMWKKIWQFVCREEDITEPGDHYRYDIAGISFHDDLNITGSITASGDISASGYISASYYD